MCSQMDMNHTCHHTFFKQGASEWSALHKHTQYVTFISSMYFLFLKNAGVLQVEMLLRALPQQ